ncbi:T9SS type A sorting domain-containing protein [Olleya aquimaris]|uniref:Putative secreted protein (Por secretion system target) n=1 Tax=Olleya aquimaris TaxID=639310 RepID=A0A327RLB3_9FLAO|nr:T9SS type A sorting domain-containing protein [Olleya aquimaris]RAJ16333.1 putative secreted protein (Por secretion system target) [Olleya aquimaris]
MKKYIIFWLLSVTVFFSFAQLTVRNNAYVFVTDEVVFVEDDVNLTEASTRFYLRDEAQLIQGSGNTGNSGQGLLSVYQEGTVHNYAYNYWCSPVGNVTANSVGNRTFTPNLNLYDVVDLTNSNLAGYSTSAYNGTSSPLNIESYWIWKYDPGTAYSEWDYVGESGTVDAGYGFTMKGTIGSTPSSGQQYDFRGKPNEGNINTAIVLSQDTLIGNPYPSALDSAAFIHDANNVSLLDSATLYFWEQDQSVNSHLLVDYRGGYAAFTINAAGTVPSFVPATFDSYNTDGTLNTTGSSSTSGKQVRRYIPIGQGFMVTGAATGSLLTSDSHRAYYKESDTNSEFFRTSQNQENTTQYSAEGLVIVPSDFKRFRLNIDFNDVYTRQLLHNFHSTASSGEDYGLESKIFKPLNSDAYWIQNNEALVTQANAFDTNLTIPVFLNLNEEQLVRFRIFDIQNFDSNQPIYIHDLDNETYVDLRQQHFEIYLPKDTYNNRFEITFKKSDFSIEENFMESELTVLQDNLNQELVIKNPNAITIHTIELYDVLGKQVLNKGFNKTDTLITVSTTSFSDGVYIAKIKSEDKQIISKKVVVKN